MSEYSLHLQTGASSKQISKGSPHRHTLASRLVMAGGDFRMVREWPALSQTRGGQCTFQGGTGIEADAGVPTVSSNESDTITGGMVRLTVVSPVANCYWLPTSKPIASPTGIEALWIGLNSSWSIAFHGVVNAA